MIKKSLEKIAEETNINPLTLNMMFLIHCLKQLRRDYEKKGLGEDLFWGISADLKNKLLECKRVYGVYGTFVFDWFKKNFSCERFALGRFQYQHSIYNFDEEYEKFGVKIKKGDPIISFHIPSSGAIDYSTRLDSYKRAYAFFNKSPERNKVMIFSTSSWLIYPKNVNLFPVGSNLYDFMKDFIIIRTKEAEGFPDSWRVFDKDYHGSTQTFVKQTTLQKNIAKWLDDGNSIGEGFGLIFFDGEKILNRAD